MIRQFQWDGLSRYDLDGPIDKVIAKLKSVKKELLREFPDAKDLTIDVDQEYAYGDSRVVVKLYYHREETEAERIERETKAAADAARREEYERECFNRLKAKFESK